MDPRTEKALDTTTIKLHLRQQAKNYCIRYNWKYIFLCWDTNRFARSFENIAAKHRHSQFRFLWNFATGWKKSENERKSWKGHWRLSSNDRNLSERWHLRECSVRNLKKSRKVWTLKKHLFETLRTGFSNEKNTAIQASPELVTPPRHAFKIPKSNLLTLTCQNNYFF